MACELTFYDGVPQDSCGNGMAMPMANQVGFDSQAVGGVASTPEAIPQGAKIVHVLPSEDTRIMIQAVETAATSSARKLVAGRDYYFGLRPGMFYSVIAA